MNKETIYKKVQDLFPSELGVGDIVTDRSFMTLQIVLTSFFNEQIHYFCYELNKDYSIPTVYVALWLTKDYHKLKLIRKAITLSMVLEAMNKKIDFKKYYYEIGWCNIDNSIEIAFLEKKIFDDKVLKHGSWQLRKDGKDLNLYDQNIDLIKLVYEVLK